MNFIRKPVYTKINTEEILFFPDFNNLVGKEKIKKFIKENPNNLIKATFNSLNSQKYKTEDFNYSKQQYIRLTLIKTLYEKLNKKIPSTDSKENYALYKEYNETIGLREVSHYLTLQEILIQIIDVIKVNKKIDTISKIDNPQNLKKNLETFMNLDENNTFIEAITLYSEIIAEHYNKTYNEFDEIDYETKIIKPISLQN